MRKILIIGATSAIAEHCARLWAARGDVLYLVARNEERLTTIASDLQIRGAAAIHTRCVDLNDLEKHPGIVSDAELTCDGIDTVLIAHGTLSHQKTCESDVKYALAEIHTNALSIISLLTIIANLFEPRNSGTIAVISSVAGDRGRASNYVYGSAKAMITAFTSGLRQRLRRSRVAVVTIKPGFVDSPMTAHFQKGLLWAKPATVANGIVRAIDRGETEVYVPGFWWLLMAIIRVIPNSIFRNLSL